MALGTEKNNSLLLISLIPLLALIIAVASQQAQSEPINQIPFDLPSQKELSKLRSATLFTNKGEVKIELFPEQAPWHVANLKYLADKGFYKNNKIHIHIPDYIIQAGDPGDTGKGGTGYSLPPEFTQRQHEAGTFGMARLEDSSNPERRSNGSQFHILMRANPRMDGGYTILGKVTSGMKVVKNLRKGDTIIDLIVYVRP